MYCCEREYRSKWKTREAVIGFTEDSVERLLEERTVELNISVGVGVCQMGEGEEHSRKKQQPGQGHGDERPWLVPAAACPGQGVVIVLVAQSCLILCDFMDCSPPGSSVRGNFPGKNTGVGGHALSSRGSSQPRDRTQVSCIAGRFFTS